MGTTNSSRALAQATSRAPGHKPSESRENSVTPETEPREQFGRVARGFSQLVAPLIRPSQRLVYESLIHLREGWLRELPLGDIEQFTRLRLRTVRAAMRRLEALGLIVRGPRGQKGAFQYFIVREASPRTRGLGVIVRRGVYEHARRIALAELPPFERTENFEGLEVAEPSKAQAQQPQPQPPPQPPKPYPRCTPLVFELGEGAAFDAAAAEWARRGFSRAQLLQAAGTARGHLIGSSFEKAPVSWLADYFEYAARASDSYGVVFNRLAVAASTHRVFAWFEARVARTRDRKRDRDEHRRPDTQSQSDFIPSADDFRKLLTALTYGK